MTHGKLSVVHDDPVAELTPHSEPQTFKLIESEGE